VPEKISEVISSLMEKGQALIGASTGNDGAALQPTTNAAAIRAKLESQAPEDTDRNLHQWLISSLSVVPQPQVSLTYPVTGGYQRTVTGYSFEGLTDDNRSEAIRAVQSAMTPATVERCEELVSTLHAVTAHRQDSENSLKVILRLYSDCLAKYPADVSKVVVERFIYRSEKPNFFPTLSEVKTECDRAAHQRQQLLRSL
tara:strand:- start:5 stop:604 length:600 start_codon:yes stop_codon:yes gene_type:complete